MDKSSTKRHFSYFLYCFLCYVAKKYSFGDARPGIGAHKLAAVGADGVRGALKEAINVTIKLLRDDSQLTPAHLKNPLYAVFGQRIAKRADIYIELLLQISVGV